MNKGLLTITAVLVIASGQAFSQAADCNSLYPVSVCQGDQACITQAQQQRAECRASQEQGNRPVMTVPEPATALLFASGLIGLALARRRGRKAGDR
jgi:hypothetical protein